jgi:anti-sigma B factor antagonist
MKETTLSLSGKIDLKRSPEIQDQLNALIEEGYTGVTVNMKDVDYLSSMGIRVLLSTYKKLKAAGGSLKVVEPSEFVYSTLKFVGLDEYIVDASTVIKSEEGSDTDYAEAVSVSLTATSEDLGKYKGSRGMEMWNEFKTKLNLSAYIVNGVELFISEINIMMGYNAQEGYEIQELTGDIDYTPDPKVLTITLVAKNHSIEHFTKNLRRINEKKFDIDDADSEQMAEQLAQRAAVAFFDAVKVEQIGNDVKGVAIKKLT